ncbi:unnamed protein product [Echinostoma caproni]|uniref:USP domain-containing protein n=1 Tax=Echinostoma caproni TaxID=27848 RepID=A0A183AV54_9TREM|nr:unnamed protein product [Echinostoma caproni]
MFVVHRDYRYGYDVLHIGEPPSNCVCCLTFVFGTCTHILKSWIGRQREKVGCHVSFPLILDLSNYMLTSTNQSECTRSHTHAASYHVDGVVNQPGSQTTSLSGTESALVSANPPDDDSKPNHSMPRRFLYHLTGVIVHHGRGFQSGHYTAYCLNDQPECWLNCNDANVTLCDFSEVAAAQAYLLFYSELMPTTPFPPWFNGPPHDGVLKRCQSNQSLGRSSQDSVASTSGTITQSGSNELKTSSGIKRAVSTPSHSLQLRSAQSKRSTVQHITTAISEPVPQTVGIAATSETVGGLGRSRSSSRRSATPDVPL